MTSILIIGSYNGQDSFGDKCLVRCVAQQLRNVFGEDTKIISHIDTNLEISQYEIPEVDFQKGISLLYWTWHNKLRHLHLPKVLQRLIAIITLPFYLIATKANRQEFRRINQEIKESPIVYFYGGTQLSEQWFWYNFIPLFLTAILCWLYGVPMYFGPQQYGPENKWQRRFLLLTLKYLVKDVRVRNKNCLELLNLPESKLCYDEVFSCDIRYSIIKDHLRESKFILVNMRGTNFLRDGENREFEDFLNLLAAVNNRLGLPFKLFQMSGASFCDDTRILDYLKNHEKLPKISLEVLPLITKEEELIEIASQAYGTISMSFHGCILSMLGGCPSVPVTSGDYYDYKYIDFDKYTGWQGVPLVVLNNLNTEKFADQICEYFAKYSTKQTAIAREKAAKAIGMWYQQIPFNDAITN
ncbi:hypothetical protein NIES4103_05480 [Nostoc sp. NIES-4103]|nr:hypothetical protein NIES4103_05480 [Nostoc sp. NIES-4103]